jgi:hypothetical protein
MFEKNPLGVLLLRLASRHRLVLPNAELSAAPLAGV